MRVTDRLRRTGAAAAMAVVAGGTAAACSATAAQPAVSPRPAAAVTGAAAPRASGNAVGSYVATVRAVLPSVVLVRTAGGLGSGVVLDRAGNIVTNAHVAGQGTPLQVQRAGDPAPRAAHLVGTYPQGVAGSVTEGIISATGRAVIEPTTPSTAAAALPDAIQTSAPINPGNSGGALVTATGHVIGIPTLAAASPQGGGQAQGIGFAIPSNLARDIAGQIIKSGHVTNSHRAALGARVATVAGVDGTARGAAVVAVTSGGAAERAGLRAGDVIRKLGPTPTPDAGALLSALAAADPGQRVELTFTRAGQAHTVPVTLGTLPAT